MDNAALGTDTTKVALAAKYLPKCIWLAELTVDIEQGRQYWHFYYGGCQVETPSTQSKQRSNSWINRWALSIYRENSGLGINNHTKKTRIIFVLLCIKLYVDSCHVFALVNQGCFCSIKAAVYFCNFPRASKVCLHDNKNRLVMYNKNIKE